MFNKSKVVDKTIQDENLRDAFSKKFCSLGLGIRVECGQRISWLQCKDPIRKIEKGGDVYHVSDAHFFSTENENTVVHTHCFLVENNGHFSSVLFEDRAERTFGSNYGDSRVEFISGDTKISLKNNTDIFDVYDLRFQLRGNKEAKQFMDDFVIVGDMDRKRYKIYAMRQFYRNGKMNLSLRKNTKSR